MKTLITGASGLVGSAVLRLLLDCGHDVRAMVRRGSNRANLSGLELEIVEGDLCDSGSLHNAVANCRYLFHIAADYRLWVPDPEQMYKANVEGTHNLLRHATEHGVKKIVYTSSVATLGIHPDRSPANEDSPVSLNDMIGHYKRSKYLAEQEVIKLVSDIGAPVTIVNPSTPIGPRDIKPTPTGRIIVDCLNGKIPAYVDTGLNIAHVDDVARGHILALDKGKIGERYILGGDDMSLKEILQKICEAGNRPSPKISIPHNLILPFARLFELWADMCGIEPLATVDGIKMSKKHMFFSSRKAKEKLGYQSRPAHEAISDAIKWFQLNGYLSN
ncbi:MAG: NAD-dependent epimerase/dehydratase family protein [Gammaproteobacteria bacterium]|nr:NAD-dependent epimerase/dehydratase family protein [Gammaproteobacteria bacterium]